MSAQRYTGTVNHWNKAFRSGFITKPAGFDRDVYVTYTDVQYRPGHGHDLQVGDVVEFEIVPGNKPGRLKAINVRVIPNQKSQIKNQK